MKENAVMTDECDPSLKQNNKKMIKMLNYTLNSDSLSRCWVLAKSFSFIAELIWLLFH